MLVLIRLVHFFHPLFLSAHDLSHGSLTGLYR